MKIIDIYKSFDSSQKINFWTVATNVILVMFTAWLGFTIQDIVVSKNTKMQSDILKYELGEKLYPAFDSIYYGNGYIINTLGTIANDSALSEVQQKAELKKFFKENDVQIRNFANRVVTTLGKLRFYLDKEEYNDSIEKNNRDILTVCTILTELDSISSNPEYVRNKHLMSDLINSNEYFINCGTSTANRTELDETYNELYHSIDFSNYEEARMLLFTKLGINLLNNLKIFSNVIEGKKTENKIKEICTDPVVLLIFTFVAIIIILQIITRFMAPKNIGKTISRGDYDKLEKEKRGYSETVKIRDNTIHRLESVIKEQKMTINELQKKRRDKSTEM